MVYLVENRSGQNLLKEVRIVAKLSDTNGAASPVLPMNAMDALGMRLWVRDTGYQSMFVPPSPRETRIVIAEFTHRSPFGTNRTGGRQHHN